MSDSEILFPEEEETYQWQKVKKIGGAIAGEIESSSKITGNHGEFHLTEGHFFCNHPYP